VLSALYVVLTSFPSGGKATSLIIDSIAEVTALSWALSADRFGDQSADLPKIDLATVEMAWSSSFPRDLRDDLERDLRDDLEPPADPIPPDDDLEPPADPMPPDDRDTLEPIEP